MQSSTLRIDILTVPTSFCCAWLKFSLRPRGKDLDPFGSPWYGIKKPMKQKCLCFFKHPKWCFTHGWWMICPVISWKLPVCCETNARKIHEMLRLRFKNLAQFPCYDAQLEYQMANSIDSWKERVWLTFGFLWTHGFVNPWWFSLGVLGVFFCWVGWFVLNPLKLSGSLFATFPCWRNSICSQWITPRLWWLESFLIGPQLATLPKV